MPTLQFRIPLFVLGTVLLLMLAAMAGIAPDQASPVLASDTPGLILIPLRVTTPEYVLTSEGLTVPGYGFDDTPGAPKLPVWQTVVELPGSGDWTAEAQVVRSQKLTTDSVLPSVPVPTLSVSGDSHSSDEPVDLSQIDALPEVDAPSPAIYGTDALYPATIVEAGPDQWQRDKRFLTVRVYPFQYNPVSGEIIYASDIEVSIRLTPSAAASPPVPSFPPVNEMAQGVNRQGSFRIKTAERGIYRVSYAELTGAGVPPTDLVPSGLRMTSQGQEVAIEIVGGDDNSFDPGDYILFYAEPFESRWTKNNVYWLAFGGTTGTRIATRSAPQSGVDVSVTLRRAKTEKQEIYLADTDRPTDQDHIVYSGLSPNRSAPGTTDTVVRDYPASLVAPLVNGDASIRFRMQGFKDHPAYNPDTSVEVLVNGVSAGVFQWDGNQDFIGTGTIPQTALQDGANTIRVVASLNQLPGAPGLYSYTVYPDWFEITYNGSTIVTNDRLYLERVADGQNHVTVTGFSATPGTGSRVYDVRDSRTPVRLTTTQQTSGILEFWDQAIINPSYFVSADTSFLTATSIVRDTPSTLNSTANNASYIAIYHQSLLNALDPLLDHRESEGFQVARVEIQDVFDEFNYGIVDQEALKEFLSYAYFNWNSGGTPPEYVFIVGDSSLDFRGETPGISLPGDNLIPTYFKDVDPWIGETSVDNALVSVNGPTDILPDMHLGRLSAHNPISVTNYVNKVLTYEQSGPAAPWRSEAVYVADNDADPAGNFHILQENLRTQWLPSTMTSEQIYYDPDGSGSGNYTTDVAARGALMQAYNDKALLATWFGHASRIRWGSGVARIIDRTYIAPLQANTAWPITLHMSCWSSYYLVAIDYGSTIGSLSDAFVMRSAARGSIGDIGPTGFHVGSALLKMGQGIQQSLFRDRQDRLGAVVDDARYHYFANSFTWLDTIETTLLTGDPALKIQLPASALHTSSTLTDAPDPVTPGQAMSYTFQVVNSGNAPATNTVATLDYDESVGTIQAGHGGTDDGSTITWNLGTVPVGGTVTKTVSFQVNANAQIGYWIQAGATVVSDSTLPFDLSATTVVVDPNTITPTPEITPTATRTPTATPTVPPALPRLYLPFIVK